MSPRSRFGSVYRKSRGDGSEYAGWFVRFVESGKRVERGGFATSDAASAYLAKRQIEKSEARALGLKTLTRTPVRDAVDEYRKWMPKNRRPATVRGSAVTLKLLVTRAGARDVLSLSADDVGALLDALRNERQYAPGSLVHALRVVSAFLHWCVERHYARENVAKGLRRRLPKVDSEAPPYLSPGELRLIYAAVPPEVRPIAVLWGDAGLRLSEALFLQWGELRPDFGAVTIRGDRSKGHRTRTVHLTARATAALRVALDGRARPMLGGERVFELSRTQCESRFRAAMDKLGRPDVTPKTLRHAFGSGAALRGVDLEILRRLMGHKSIETTMIYACHRPGGMEEAAIRTMEDHEDSSAIQVRKAT